MPLAPHPQRPRQLARQLARIQARYQRHAAELAHLGFMLKGSLVQRFLTCSTPSCRCHADPPQLHGPYWQWSRRVQGKTVSRMLPAEEVPRYREWMENAHQFETIVAEMHALSVQAAALLTEQQRASSQTSHLDTRPTQARKSAARR